MSPMGKCRLWVNVSWMWSRSSWSSSQLFNFSLGQYVIGQVLTWSTYYMVNLVHQKIDFAHNIIYNWIYPTTRPDRARSLKSTTTRPAVGGPKTFWEDQRAGDLKKRSPTPKFTWFLRFLLSAVGGPKQILRTGTRASSSSCYDSIKKILDS